MKRTPPLLHEYVDENNMDKKLHNENIIF